MDEQLEQLYRKNWSSLCSALQPYSGLSNPLLASVPYDYEAAIVRLLVVGQETHGWWGEWKPKEDVDYVKVLRGYYCLFSRGRTHSSHFFRMARRLQERVNPGADPFGFMWLNLYLCDQNNDLPKEPAATALRTISLLRQEINILNPSAIVFFTGPEYDFTIKKYFPDAELTALSRSRMWCEFNADGITAKMARTYHPDAWLWGTRRSAIMDEIGDWIRKR
jgi:hypothetical protein